MSSCGMKECSGEVMTKTQMSFFRMAKNASELSDFPRIKIGAIVVNKHRVVSSGCNSFTKRHRLQVKYNRERFDEPSDGCVHAEMSALIPLVNKEDLSRASIYVYRQLKDGSLGMCRPCKACMALIKNLGIRKVYYTTYDGYAEEYIEKID